MSEAPERPSGIKRLEEEKKGRFWGFIHREASGTVTPLSPVKMARRLRHLLVSSIKTMSSYTRREIGESGLRNMFEDQAIEFARARGLENQRWTADRIARDMIRLNFQPLGMEAEYSGDAEVSKIVVNRCPLPQRFLQDPEFLLELSFESEGKGLLDDLKVQSHTARGEWPPKSIEICSVCRIVMPRMGEKLGFIWEHGLTDDKPPRCFFIIRTEPEK